MIKLVRSLPPVIYKSLSDSWQAFGYITKACGFSFYERWMARVARTFVMYKVAKNRAKSQGIHDPVRHLQGLLKELGDQLKAGFLSQASHPGAADVAIWGFLDSLHDLKSFEIIKSNEAVYTWYQKVHSHFVA